MDKNRLYHHKNASSFTIISSEDCNLKCSYCVLAKSIKSMAENGVQRHSCQKAIEDAFDSKQFLVNIKNVLKKLKINQENIENIELWGQEPTLTLDRFSLLIPDLFHEFPNLSSFIFSTNGAAYIERLVDYIKAIDKYYPNTKKDMPCVIKIQFSYDGAYSNDSIRKVGTERLEKNIKKFCSILNQYNFKNNLVIYLNLHNVVSLELLNYLNNDKEKIKQYWLQMIKFSEEVNNILYNPKVIFAPGVSPAIEIPAHASKEDGICLNNFINICEELKENDNELKFFYSYEGLLKQHTDGITRILKKVKDYTFKDILYYINGYFNDDLDIIQNISALLMCGAFTEAFKIRYDGSLVYCQNVVSQLDNHNIQFLDGIEYKIQTALNNNPYQFINPLKDSNEIINTHFEKNDILLKNIFIAAYSTVIQQMILLLKCNQIDESYNNNYEKLLLHSFFLTLMILCPDANVKETGSFAGRPFGQIRLYANGFLDKVEENVKECMKKEGWCFFDYE